MTNKDRIIRTLTCRQTDHAPLVSWLGFSPWAETKQRWIKETGFQTEPGGRNFGQWREELFGLKPLFSVAPLEYGPFPRFPHKEISRDSEFVICTDHRGITMRSRLDGGSMPEWIGHPVKSREDWEQYKVERLQPDAAGRLAQLDHFLDVSAKIDAPIQVGIFPWGVFGTARDLLGAEEVLIGFYTEPEMIRDIMQTYTSIWLSLYEKVAERVHIDHIHIWEDMSGKQGSLVSPAMIEDFMMPEYDRIAAFARKHGVEVVSVDTDGQVDELVPLMMKHGVNAFMPFEVQAGCDIESFGKQYPGLGIMGGLDKRALALDQSAMHRELDRAEKMLARGGWLPGFDHMIPPDVPWANYRYFMERLRKLVGE